MITLTVRSKETIFIWITQSLIELRKSTLILRSVSLSQVLRSPYLIRPWLAMVSIFPMWYQNSMKTQILYLSIKLCRRIDSASNLSNMGPSKRVLLKELGWLLARAEWFRQVGIRWETTTRSGLTSMIYLQAAITPSDCFSKLLSIVFKDSLMQGEELIPNKESWPNSFHKL